MSATLTDDTRSKLAEVATASITTALFKRGFRNLFMQGPRLMNPAAPRLVGEAYTLRYIPAREDLDHIEVFKDRTHPQRKAVEECPAGHVLVVDSRGDRSAASAGGILVTRLMVRGVAGIVTDGGFRDSGEIAALDFAAYHVAPSAPTNLIRHHAVDVNQPIGCGGAPVYPGDVVVGDVDGVVVIPAHLADEIADEVYEMTIFEDYVQERVREGRSTFGLYPPTDPEVPGEFAAWREERSR